MDKSAAAVLGLLTGVGCGLLLGTWLGTSAMRRPGVLPTFVALAQIPTLAWIPLFMLFFGIGELLKLVVLVKAVVVPVTLHTLVGVRDAQPKLREAAAALRLPRHLLFLRLLLPAACRPSSLGCVWPWRPAGPRCSPWSCWPPARASAT